MYKIVDKKTLAPNIFLMDVEAPRIAKSCSPGQFIIVKAEEESERIPLTICDYNNLRGTVTIIFKVHGISTKKISKYKIGQVFSDFAGPLGQPSSLLKENLEDLKKRSILFIAGGIGAAHIYSQVKWLHEHGVTVDVIVGFNSKEDLILENELRIISSNFYVATDDGSYEYKGSPVDLLKELIEKEKKHYDHIVTIGSMNMMKSVCKTTKDFNIKTIVSLKQIIVDGIGLCGGCRVTVGGETKFACIDGPEFDGHLVDFEEAIRRQSMYKTEEGKALIEQEEEAEGHKCHIGLDV